MNQFENFEKDFEDKHCHIQESDFKVQTRCNKLLGARAAQKLGPDGAVAEA